MKTIVYDNRHLKDFLIYCEVSIDMGRITEMLKATCAFTGHRPKSFPWKYDETASDCVLLREVLAAQIRALMDRA